MNPPSPPVPISSQRGDAGGVDKLKKQFREMELAIKHKKQERDALMLRRNELEKKKNCYLKKLKEVEDKFQETCSEQIPVARSIRDAVQAGLMVQMKLRLDKLKIEVDDINLTVHGFDKERNIYYGKLRDIEVMAQETSSDQIPCIEDIRDILQAGELREMKRAIKHKKQERDALMLRRNELEKETECYLKKLKEVEDKFQENNSELIPIALSMRDAFQAGELLEMKLRLDKLKIEVDDIKLTVHGFHKKRDVYYGKLRDIEVMAQGTSSDQIPFIEDIRDILQAGEAGFAPPEEGEDVPSTPEEGEAVPSTPEEGEDVPSTLEEGVGDVPPPPN